MFSFLSWNAKTANAKGPHVFQLSKERCQWNISEYSSSQSCSQRVDGPMLFQEIKRSSLHFSRDWFSPWCLWSFCGFSICCGCYLPTSGMYTLSSLTDMLFVVLSIKMDKYMTLRGTNYLVVTTLVVLCSTPRTLDLRRLWLCTDVEWTKGERKG